MNAIEQEKLVAELLEKRMQGVEFGTLRKELVEKGLERETITQIMSEVNEHELEAIQEQNIQINPNVFLVLAIITAVSGIALAYYINRVTAESSYQLLNAIPLAGSAILFYNYYQIKKKYGKA